MAHKVKTRGRRPETRGAARDSTREARDPQAIAHRWPGLGANGRCRPQAGHDAEAVARGRITIAQRALRAIRAGKVAKGDPLQAARVAGIMAAKRTAELIPLCHPLPLSHVQVELRPRRDGYTIEASVRTSAQTGVEMEALTAVAVAALTVYDMVKALDRGMVIGDVLLGQEDGREVGEVHPLALKQLAPSISATSAVGLCR